MANKVSQSLLVLGYSKICKLHGTISFSAETSGAGNLQLWRHTKQEEYGIKACKPAEGGQPVCCSMFCHVLTFLQVEYNFH